MCCSGKHRQSNQLISSFGSHQAERQHESAPTSNYARGAASSTASRYGWEPKRQAGSHVQLQHPMKPGRVTVAVHSTRVIDPKTLASALCQAGITIEQLRELL